MPVSLNKIFSGPLSLAKTASNAIDLYGLDRQTAGVAVVLDRSIQIKGNTRPETCRLAEKVPAPDKDKAEAALAKVSTAPIFWEVLSIGRNPIKFLDRLDTRGFRFDDNAKHQPIGSVDAFSDAAGQEDAGGVPGPAQ